MVDRVGSGTGYHIYDNVNLSDNGSQTSDHKETDYADIAENLSEEDRRGVVLDLSGADKKTAASKKDNTETRPDISAVLKNDTDMASGTSDTSSAPFASITDTINKIITGIRNFFSSLWNGADEKTSAAGTASNGNAVTDSAAAADSDSAKRSASVSNGSSVTGVPSTSSISPVTGISASDSDPISQTDEVIDLPKTDDLDSIRSYLNDYNGHRLARNSSLLTSYDRFGRLVEPDVSDKDKILRGDSESLMNQLRKKK